jgi:hypothetical protein
MRKKSYKLVKSILNEAIGDPGTHTWEVPHPQTAWERLSPEQQTHVNSLHQQGRLHPDGHLHGWQPGTGPLFGRDFSGRSNEDYRNLHKRYKQELIGAGHRPEDAHRHAVEFVTHDRRRAHEAGIAAHSAAMGPIRQEQKKKAQASQNIHGTKQQQQYKEDSEKLFHAAMSGASDSADYYRTGAANEREHEKQGDYINIDARHPQLSDEAKKHLGALTDFSRAAIHTGVWGGLQSAGKEFSKDAMEHWNKTFTGIKPKDANINHPLDIIPSLLKPEHLNAGLKRYSSHTLSGRSQHSRMPETMDNKDQRPRLPIGNGSDRAWGLRTYIPDSHDVFHKSVRGLGFGTSTRFKDESHVINDSIRSHITGSLIPLHMGAESPFKTKDNHWERDVAHDNEQQHHANFRKAVGAGLKHIWSIPNISDHDRELLHRHFESQLRHHYVAAVANPRMFNQYHESMETARREREQAKGEEQQRQRQSSSGEAPKASSSRPRSGAEIGQEMQAHIRLQNWPHIKHPQDVLGLKLTKEKIEYGKIKIEPQGQFDDPDKKIAAVRKAHARLSEIHHPDNGGDPATHRMIQDALAHYERENSLYKEAEEADAASRKRKAEKETWPHSETPHEVLGLKPNASREEIRKAHRALKLKYHPDVNTAPDAKERFMKINQAHDWLTRDLNEWVIMMAEWVSKRYKK